MNKKNASINIWPSGYRDNAFCMDDNSLWFMYGNMNALMKCDLTTGKTNYIGSVMGEKITGSYILYSQIIQYVDKIYLIPKDASRMAIYNIKSCVFEHVESLDVSDFRCIHIVGEYMYLVPVVCNKSILVLNINTLKIEKTIDLSKNEFLQANKAGVNCVYDGKNLYIPTYDDKETNGCVIKLNCKDDSIELILKNVSGIGFGSIALLQDSIYLSCQHNKVYIVDRDTLEVIDVLEGIGKNTLILGTMQDKILVDSADSDEVYMLNEERVLDVLFSKHLGEDADNYIRSGQTGAFEYYDTFGVYYCRDNAVINILDNNGSSLKQLIPTMTAEDMRAMWKELTDNIQGTINENRAFALQSMLIGLLQETDA